MALAARAGAALVPYGGGTSVVGGVTARPRDARSSRVDLGGTAGLRGLDETSGLATFGAGTTGPAIEAALAPPGGRSATTRSRSSGRRSVAGS